MSLNWEGKKVLVLGLGCFGGGAAVVRFLHQQGSQVQVTDLRSARELASVLESLADIDFDTFLAANPPAALDGVDALVVNPAVPPHAPLLREARQRQLYLTSETELLLRHCQGTVTAITGTNGKSTTTAMLGHLLQEAGYPVVVGGNLGHSLLPLVPEITRDHQVILELSSFQADLLPGDKLFERLIVTNATTDHLDRYGEMAAYHNAKKRILGMVRPGGVVVLNRDDQVSSSWPLPVGVKLISFGSSAPGADEMGLVDGNLQAQLTAGTGTITPINTLPLPGAFQVENCLAAAAGAILAGMEPSLAGKGIRSFTGVDHRLEPLGKLGAVNIVDNGVSTAPETTISALEALPGPVHLVTGGKSKGADPAPFAAAVNRLATSVHLFGQTGPQLALEMEKHPTGCDWSISANLEEALNKGLAACGPGDTLLFSPGHSSFDAYLNFKERAGAFRRWLAETRIGELSG